MEVLLYNPKFAQTIWGRDLEVGSRKRIARYAMWQVTCVSSSDERRVLLPNRVQQPFYIAVLNVANCNVFMKHCVKQEVFFYYFLFFCNLVTALLLRMRVCGTVMFCMCTAWGEQPGPPLDFLWIFFTIECAAAR